MIRSLKEKKKKEKRKKKKEKRKKKKEKRKKKKEKRKKKKEKRKKKKEKRKKKKEKRKKKKEKRKKKKKKGKKEKRKKKEEKEKEKEKEKRKENKKQTIFEHNPQKLSTRLYIEKEKRYGSQYTQKGPFENHNTFHEQSHLLGNEVHLLLSLSRSHHQPWFCVFEETKPFEKQPIKKVQTKT